MKKYLVIGTALLLALALAVPAFAAFTDAQKQEINDINKQMIELRKQLIDKYVGAGTITDEQGQLMKERLDQMQQYRSENGILPGAGGCGRGGQGPGFGLRGGSGGPGAGCSGSGAVGPNVQSSAVQL